MSQVTLKGDPVKIGGSFPQIGDTVKDFSLANNKRENVSLESFASKNKILNIFPSVDTPT
ncbi:MAG: lipid hydroperoxide peroxidase, partial [Nitrosomonadales bacterium]|nr:lipid hydroperoxide peroxidase [Nitrosomonadales bacterium]